MLDLIDQPTLLTTIAIGTLLIYLFIPTPNVLYRESNTNSNIINFGENTECYGVKTTEIDCPFHEEEQVSNEETPHNFNMNMNIEDK
mgnify:CR=1 FL=1|tara:strand:- start:3370 stop:3630 length:261 start_codon:yes stop_codon:yes gene_type:complete